MPSALAEVLQKPVAWPAINQMRGALVDATESVLRQINAKLVSAEEARAELRRLGVDLRSWAQAIKAGLESQDGRVRQRAAEELGRFERLTAEEINLAKMGLGLDGQGQGGGGGDLHLHIHDPETARVLAMAARSPEVAAALRAAVERIGREGEASQAGATGDPRS